MTPIGKSWAGHDVYETLHGTENIFDSSYYGTHGGVTKINWWGIDDGPFLKESANILHRWEKEKKPYFVKISTMSTHAPFSVKEEGPLPDHLLYKTSSQDEYPGYLSLFKYSQKEITLFLKDMLFGPEGERTLIVLLGDQVTVRNTVPHANLSDITRQEIFARDPIFFLTKIPSIRIDRSKSVQKLNCWRTSKTLSVAMRSF